MVDKEVETEIKMGSAESYRRAVAERRRKETVVSVLVPSGFRWDLRAPDLQGYVMTGRMPQSLLDQFLKSAEKRGVVPDDLKAMSDLKESYERTPPDADEAMNALIFMRELVREACVNPRIVVGGTADDEIDPSEMHPDDFKFIVDWCLSHMGVTGVAGLQTFRNRHERRAVDAGTRRKGVSRKTVKAVKR
jgi:hypothetical protein